MSAKKGLKGFLLFKNLGFDQEHGCYAVYPVCIVVAESFENAAETVGGKFAEITIARHEKAKSVVFPKSLFKPRKEDSKHPGTGELLEYRRGDLYLCIN